MPPPQKKNIFKRRGGGEFWCLSLIVPGFFWWGKASMSNLHWKNDGNGFLDLINISDGVHKLQSSKVFLIYYKPYVSDILLINVNLYDISREGHCYSCFIGIWRTWNHLAWGSCSTSHGFVEEENATMDKEADMNVDQELSLVYRKILHFIPSLLLPTSRGFLVYMMVRFILIRQELLKSCITLAFPVI